VIFDSDIFQLASTHVTVESLDFMLRVYIYNLIIQSKSRYKRILTAYILFKDILYPT